MKLKKPEKFIFESYEIDKGNSLVRFSYSFDTGLRFTEQITLPQGVAFKGDRKLLDNILFNLHLAAGIGYYKAFCPKKIEVRSGVLSKKQAAFWNKLYTKGLGEFFYRNKIDYRGLVSFPYKRGYKPAVSNKAFKDRCLSPIGGGKDSLLAAEKLGQTGKDFTLISLRDSRIQADTAKLAGKSRLVFGREIDPLLFELNKQGAYNGHVPISALYSWICVLAAALEDYRYIVFANEASANFGNVRYLGEEINHQYSKSFEFERDFASYLKDNVAEKLEYFSILRPLTELRIAYQFSAHKKYLPAFSSCNRNFRITEAAASRWCGECPKCAFTYSLLSAFLPRNELKKIFGKDMFRAEMLPLFQELWGEKRIKPFDCVGTPEEVKAALLLARNRGYDKDPVMEYFVKKIAPKIKDKKKIIAQAFAVNKEHAVPASFRPTVILGRGEEGNYLADYYRRLDPKTVISFRDKKDGPHYLESLTLFDVIAKSPGISSETPELQEALEKGAEMETVSRIFFRHERDRIIGITGTKGKSTTSSLIYSILKAAGKKAYLVGNIGADPLHLIGEDAWFVYELSSYQLSTLEESPHIAVFISLFPDHLPYHQGFDNYAQAKANIARFQQEGDVFVYNSSFPFLNKLAKHNKAKALPYDQEVEAKDGWLLYGGKKIIEQADISLPGEHNLKNIGAAIAVAKELKIANKAIREGIANFRGLPHRLENIGSYRGIDFYDDAISTTPESTMAALDYLGEKTGCIFLGGEDRGYDFSSLAKRLTQLPLSAIILFPYSGARIKDALMTAYKNNLPPILETSSMEEAVRFAFKQTPAGKACLLSTASPSYSLWKDYKEKGDLFKNYVKQFGRL
ncbi:MAG: UDP-N-acetylmuramoyl-L-alanine--D-glutamate ligase [Bacillota bacterium]